jgi:surface carbohydrate biosynthesis protein
MKIKKEIYIAIEIKVREYLSKIFLSFFLARRGYRVFLGSKDQIISLIQQKKNNNGILFYKAGIHKNLIKIIDKKTNSQVVIDQEVAPGYTDKKIVSEHIRGSFHKDTLKKIDLYFSPNQRLHKMCKKLLSLMRGKVVFSGWPRIDLWKPKYKFLFQNKINDIDLKYKNYILFNSDFGFVTNDYINEATQYNLWGNEDNKNKQNKFYNKQIKLAKEIHSEFKVFSDKIKKFSQKNIHQLILIRIHPSENLQVWKNTFYGCRNIKLMSPIDDVTPWIYCAKYVLHRGCTTALQAAYMNKPTGYFISDKKFKTHLKHKKIIYDISDKIFNISELSKKINTLKINKKTKNIKKKINKELGIKDKDSVAYIIKELDKLLCNRSITKKINKKFSYYLFIIHYKNLLLRLILKTLNTIGYTKKSASNFGRSNKIFGGISKKESKKYIDLLNKKFNKKIKTLNFDNDIVIIEE